MKSSQCRPAVKRAMVRKGITATAKLALELRLSRSWGVIRLCHKKDTSVFAKAVCGGHREVSRLGCQDTSGILVELDSGKHSKIELAVPALARVPHGAS